MVKDKVLLIDGLNFIFRAKITFKPKNNEEQEPFTMVFNFFRNLRALLEELNPTICFIGLEGKNNFRYNLFPEYKGNRIKTAEKQKEMDDFHIQKRIILELLPFLPIRTVKANTYECDDVLATLAENLKDEEVIIVSNDTDYIQLLQKGYKNLKIYNPFSKKYMEPPAYHYLGWKSLAGDKSDNIPGLISNAKAIKLLNSPSDLNRFLSSEENRANFYLNKDLIELRIVPEDQLEISDYNINYDLLRQKFAEMDFKTIIAEKYWDRFVNTFKKLS